MHLFRTQYESALAVAATARQYPEFWAMVGGLVDRGRGKVADPFDAPGLGVVPDQFVAGPLFVGLGSDTDCDGTSYFACGIVANTLDEAWKVRREQWSGMTGDSIYDIVTLAEFKAEHGDDPFHDLVEDPDFRYISLGANWNPWVYDDTLGTILDHSMEV